MARASIARKLPNNATVEFHSHRMAERIADARAEQRGMNHPLAHVCTAACRRDHAESTIGLSTHTNEELTTMVAGTALGAACGPTCTHDHHDHPVDAKQEQQPQNAAPIVGHNCGPNCNHGHEHTEQHHDHAEAQQYIPPVIPAAVLENNMQQAHIDQIHPPTVIMPGTIFTEVTAVTTAEVLSEGHKDQPMHITFRDHTETTSREDDHKQPKESWFRAMPQKVHAERNEDWKKPKPNTAELYKEEPLIKITKSTKTHDHEIKPAPKKEKEAPKEEVKPKIEKKAEPPKASPIAKEKIIPDQKLHGPKAVPIPEVKPKAQPPTLKHDHAAYREKKAKELSDVICTIEKCAVPEHHHRKVHHRIRHRILRSWPFSRLRGKEVNKVTEERTSRMPKEPIVTSKTPAPEDPDSEE